MARRKLTCERRENFSRNVGLTRFSAAPSAGLRTLRSKATGLFRPSAEWRRRGLWNPLMYLKIAISACLRVFHVSRQISSALMDLKTVSTAALS